MHAFEYVAPHSVDDAVTLLQESGDAQVLSGGTDLIPQMKEGRRRPPLVVDVKHIPELNELVYDPVEGLWLGAAVPCHRIVGNGAIARAYPGLVEAISLIGGIQIQGRATVGGNLCNASPAADSIPALIAHRAVCHIAGPKGPRTVPVEDFCTAPGETVLEPGELLVKIHVPAPPPNHGGAYQRFIPRNEMDIAVVGAGAALVLDESGQVIQQARIALGAVAPRPLFVEEAGAFLAGKPVSEEVLEEAARLAREAARPITDMRGTAAQRKHLSHVLTRRVLIQAVQRARGEEAGRRNGHV